MNTVLLAVQDPALATTFHAALQATGAWQVPAPVHSVADARAALIRHAPQLLVVDLRLKDGLAASLIRLLRLRQPVSQGHAPAQVLVLATNDADPLLLDALQAGADNFFVTTGTAPEALAVHVRETLAGGADIAPWIARRLLDHFGAAAAGTPGAASRYVEDMFNPLALTAAERTLLRQLSIGDRLADVAGRQGMGPRDLMARVRDIYRKMQWALHAGNLKLV